MKQLALTSAVTVKGRRHAPPGLPASITFKPFSSGGWIWHPKDHFPVPVEAQNAFFSKTGYIYLETSDRSRRLRIWEHIGGMALLGLTGVEVVSTSSPPYFGRTAEFWDALKPYVVETRAPVKWCCPVYAVESKQGGAHRLREGYTRIEPHDDVSRQSLDLDICIDFGRHGALQKEFSFPGAESALLESFTVGAPGLPASVKFPLALCMSLTFWPHLNRMVWPWTLPFFRRRTDFIELIMRHRLLDLAGGLSLAHPERLLSAKVTSFCSGHEADLGALKRMRTVPC